MSKHTPGPWKVVPDYETGRIEIVAPWSENVPTDSPRFGSCVGIHVAQLNHNNVKSSVDRTVADAQLIAKAPQLKEQRDELLEACKIAEWGGLDIYGQYCPVCGHWKDEGHAEDCKLQAAIAKCKGLME